MITIGKQNLISRIYGDDAYRQLINHLRAYIHKQKTSEIKRNLSHYEYNDLAMYPEFKGYTLNAIQLRVKPNPTVSANRKGNIAAKAFDLINEAENYRKFLEDPDLLLENGFKHERVEYKPVCGVKVDCYEGIINEQPAHIKYSDFGLEILENFGDIQNSTYISYGEVQIFFTKINKLGNETVVRKIQKFMDSDIFDWVKTRKDFSYAFKQCFDI